MEYEDLLLDKKDGIATITLNAPEKMNALTVGIKRSLSLAVDDIANDDDVRVVIVTGAGRGFCAGGDVSRMGAAREKTRSERLQVLGKDTATAFPKLDKPVIAAINGACIGAGLSVALSCDIRIASENAKFGSGFILRGLVPDNAATYYLPRVVGLSKALELMLTGKMFSAAEAEQLGIVSRVVPLDELMKVANELAAEIAKQPPVALELTKRLVWRSMIDDIAHHLDWETYAQNICHETEDHKEAVRAFMEKRPQPQFKGK